MRVVDWHSSLNSWFWNENSGLKQVGSVPNYLNELNAVGIRLTKPQMKNINDAYLITLKGIFEQAGVSPDTLQYAIAGYAMESLTKELKQMWEIMSGLGKTRIIHTAALYWYV